MADFGYRFTHRLMIEVAVPVLLLVGYVGASIVSTFFGWVDPNVIVLGF